MGILAGHLGISIDPMMLTYAESFGLVLFVYELGLKVGPGFFSSFRSGGVGLNMLGLWVILLGTVMAVGFSLWLDIPMSDMVGVLSGATTNTPALGAAQQALEQLGESAQGAALGCAVTYPLGVVGVILALIIVRKTVVRRRISGREVRTMKPTILLLPLSGLRIPASTGCRSARWPWQPKAGL